MGLGATFAPQGERIATRRAGRRAAVAALLAPLLLAFGPPQTPVEVRLEESWRWRIIDGPPGKDTVFDLVRPGTEGHLLVLDEVGLWDFDGWTWERGPGWDELSDVDVSDVEALPDGLLVVTTGDVRTVDARGSWLTLGRLPTPKFVSQAYRQADGTVEMAVNGQIVRPQLQNLQPIMPGPLEAQTIMSLTRDRDGMFWCGTDGGIYREFEDDWDRMDTGIQRTDSRPVWYLHAVSAGNLVAFLPERLDASSWGQLWDGRQLSPLPMDKEAIPVADVVGTPDGEIIVATRGPSLFVLRDGHWHEVAVPLTPRENVVSLCLTEAGQLATVFSSGRLAICDLASREWESVDTRQAGVGGSVNAISLCATGGLWVGTDGGLAHFDGDVFDWSETDVAGVRLNVVTGVCEDAEGGVWIGSGSAFKGVFRLKDGRWTRYVAPHDIGDWFVHVIRRIGDDIWFTLIGDQFVRVEYQTGGLVRWKDGQFTPFSEERDGTHMPRAYDVLERRDGILQASFWQSVRKFDGTEWIHDPTALVAARTAYALHETADGTLWVGFGMRTPGVALRRDGVWRRLVDGPWKNAAAAAFAETPDGRLWFASEKGLFLVMNDVCRDVSARLPQRVFWPVVSDGERGLWLGTLGQGLLHFEPRDTDPPKVRSVDVHFGESPFGESPDEVVARWDAVDKWNATPPEELSFNVLLDGKPPLPSGTAPTGKELIFLDLASGEHELLVSAVDGLGNISAEPRRHVFTVPPPLWRSLPVLLAATATISVLLWLLVVIRNRRRERSVSVAAQHELNERLSSLTLRLLSSQEDERRNISREMHDDLGQLLTAACLDIERATRLADVERRKEALGSALRAARDTQQRVREISHMLRPTELDDHGLPQAVATILSDFTSRSGIDVESNIQVEARALPTDVANHVFRILQEALTNILRHARAATAFVTLQATQAGIELKVSDDGVGFDPQAIPDKRRYGLLGMRERAELLGGKFSIRSKPDGGTEVSVSIPISHR